jgi:hypothetical protein
MKFLVCVLFVSSLVYGAEKKSFKQNVNETADQIDHGTRNAIKEVKGILKPKEKKK